MIFMEWEDCFNVGDPCIDEHHKGLVRIVNDFYDKLPQSPSPEEERVMTGQFLKKLGDYAQMHFQAEENILLERQYPQLPEQQKAHSLFMQELRKLEAGYAAGTQELSFDVFIFARHWIANHIKQEDQKYAPYLSQ